MNIHVIEFQGEIGSFIFALAHLSFFAISLVCNIEKNICSIDFML